jgi:SAM-dependent methyltransferase
MTDWTAGYISDIGYTYGYYIELNPQRARFACLYAGFEPPTASRIHCELGFGQGISTNIHAAASASTWYANDFNPAQVSFANSLVESSGANAFLSDESFAEFSQRADLPNFDSIGLHGIWSWISDENRAVIVDFIRRKLKVGGVLYISYNTLPGWSNYQPMRHLMTEHAEILGAAGNGTVKNIENALDFAQKLLDTKPNYLTANPQVAERFSKIKTQDKNYLAHEYFNRDWEPMHFATVQKWLSSAKIQYACSAGLMDNLDMINLSKDQIGLIKSIDDPIFKETLRDYCVNQQFRRDYWIKGRRNIKPQQRKDLLCSLKVMLVKPQAEVQLKAVGPQGEITLNQEIYEPILNCLSDHKSKLISQIEVDINDKNIKIENLLEAIYLLISLNAISLVQDDGKIKEAKVFTEKLNEYLINKSALESDLNYLASPVIGSGIFVGRIQQLFLLAKSKGHKKTSEWASFTWEILKSQNQRILLQGKPLETNEENLNELSKQAADFEKTRLPILKLLGIV